MTFTEHMSVEESMAREAYEIYSNGVTATKWGDVSDSMRAIWIRSMEGALEVADRLREMDAEPKQPRQKISDIDWEDPDPMFRPKSKATLRGEDVIEPSDKTFTVITDGVKRPKGVLIGNVDISKVVTELTVNMDTANIATVDITIVPDRIETIDQAAWYQSPNPWAGSTIPMTVTKGNT